MAPDVVELVAMPACSCSMVAVVGRIELAASNAFLGDAERPQRGDVEKRAGEVRRRHTHRLVLELHLVRVAARHRREAVDLLLPRLGNSSEPAALGRIQ